MMEKIDITNAVIAEEIRKQMSVVSSSRNGLMPSSGFITRANILKTSDYNECLNSGIYLISDNNMEAANNPGINYGVLCVFSTGAYIIQFATSVMFGVAKIRTRTENVNEWRAWFSI